MYNLLLKIGLIFTIFSVFFVYSCTRKSGSNDTDSFKTEKNEKVNNNVVYNIGDKVENFTLKDPDGNTISLDNYKNEKAKVIIFWSLECPVVKEYNNRVVKMYNEYKEKNVVFLPVYSNVTESINDIKEHYKENGYTWTVLIDEKNKIADMFSASNTPQVYVLDGNNILVYKGRVDDSRNESSITSKDLQNALNEVLANNEVTVKTTKAFGCTIKR